MGEREEALGDLDDADVLAGLRWAHRSAYGQVLRDYNPASGHSQAWFGITAHTLMCDRLDRVFSCGKYAVQDASDSGTGLDVLGDGLLQEDLESMPRVPTDTVVHDPVNGSPGWRCGTWRWLLQSFPHGSAHTIAWARHSETKRLIAAQPDPEQLALDLRVDGTADAASLLPDPLAATLSATLILGHAVDHTTGAGELPLGRPRFNPGGGEAWYWCTDLLRGFPPGASRGGGLHPTSPAAPATNEVPDAPVRLRRPQRPAEAADSAGD